MNHRIISQLRAPKTIIVVLRDRFELRLHRKKGSRYTRQDFLIAVGRIGDATPGGIYWVDAKTRKPDWLVPNHPDYYGKGIVGKTIPFEHEDNPFAGGFISLSDEEGVGIHAVRFDPQLGKRASHGCIRMAEKDFLSIYRQVPLGTPVHIV